MGEFREEESNIRSAVFWVWGKGLRVGQLGFSLRKGTNTSFQTEICKEAHSLQLYPQLQISLSRLKLIVRTSDPPLEKDGQNWMPFKVVLCFLSI